MIYSQVQNICYYGGSSVSLFVYPQIVFPLNFENYMVNFAGNIGT
jgi:hypothetical protein